MLIAVIVLWIICGYLCCKHDSVISYQPTWEPIRIGFAMFIWPIVFVLILFTKHYTGIVHADGKRVEGIYPDRWNY